MTPVKSSDGRDVFFAAIACAVQTKIVITTAWIATLQALIAPPTRN
jgi:hypothetical protein